jgi:ketosteroid isomerase-like protein
MIRGRLTIRCRYRSFGHHGRGPQRNRKSRDCLGWVSARFSARAKTFLQLTTRGDLMNLKNSTRFFLSLVCALTLAACGQNSSAPDAAADAAALATAAGGWEKAYNEKDADAMASLYTEDGQLLPPGAGELTGRDAIRAYFANDIEKQWAKISIRSDSSGIGGDWAWRSGSWSVETPPIVTGKYA